MFHLVAIGVLLCQAFLGAGIVGAQSTEEPVVPPQNGASGSPALAATQVAPPHSTVQQVVPPVLSQAYCNNTVADVVFVLDSSGSVGSQNFNIMKTFVKTFIQQLDIGRQLTRVGVMTFNIFPNLQIRLNDYVIKGLLLQAVDRLRYSSGITQTNLALDLLAMEGFDATRRYAPKVAIVITDGQSFHPNLTLASATTLKRMGVNVFTIGIGSTVRAAELNGIASSPSSGHVFQVTDFNALSGIESALQRAACNVTSPTIVVNATATAPIATQKPITDIGNTSISQECNETLADIVFVLDSSGSLGQDNFNSVKQFVINVVKALNIGVNQTKVGVITFNNFPSVRLYLDTYHDKLAIINAINRIPYYPGNTETNLALDLLMLDGFIGGRPDAPDVAIVVTDGKSTEPDKTKVSALATKTSGVTVFAVGVGNGTNKNELDEISSDPDNNFVFQVTDFAALSSIEGVVARSTCEAPLLLQQTTEAPTPTTTKAPVTTGDLFTTPATEAPTTEALTTEEVTTESPSTAQPQKTTEAPTTVATDAGTTGSSCVAKVADVMFLVDASGSVGQANFDSMKDFVKRTIDFFDVGTDYTRVGLITFSTAARLQFGLATFNTSAELNTAIDSIRYSAGGTDTAAALELLRTKGFTFGRPAVPNIAVILTDGISRDSLATRQQAMLARQSGVTLIAIGIGGGTDVGELASIASANNQNTPYVYQVGDFQALAALEIEVAHAACQVGKATGSPVAQGPSTTPGSTQPLGCVDTIANCGSFGRDACSDYQPWARSHCSLYCGFCPGPSTTEAPCVNKLANCAEYGTYICTSVSLAQWTENNCRAYCGLCGNNTAPTNPPVVATTKPAPAVCKNTVDNCKEYGGKAMCNNDAYYAWANSHCREYCGFCTSYTLVKETVLPKTNTTCPAWQLPKECTMVTYKDGCCPLPLCPPEFILSAVRKET